MLTSCFKSARYAAARQQPRDRRMMSSVARTPFLANHHSLDVDAFEVVMELQAPAYPYPAGEFGSLPGSRGRMTSPVAVPSGLSIHPTRLM